MSFCKIYLLGIILSFVSGETSFSSERASKISKIEINKTQPLKIDRYKKSFPNYKRVTRPY